MKQVILYCNFMLAAIMLSCNANKMNGVYVCDESQKTGEKTETRGATVYTTLDFTCFLESIDFKGASTVELRTNNGSIGTSYVVDEDFVRIKGSGADLIFKI